MEEGAFFLCLHAYLDVSFPQHNHLNAKAVRSLYALHIVDHVRKARGEDGGRGNDSQQGFTRGRVLVLCPFRSVCFEVVKLTLALMPAKKQVAHMQRFEEEFGGEEDGSLVSKPQDYQHLFGGNSDDRFRIGVTLWKKGVRLYAPFDKADILICSPLGLRQITGAEGERRREFDFLSSIEVCIVDRADVLRMQNWEHVQEVMQVVNRKPQGLEEG
ncbi:U3 small nucleolar RNA-associated protein 25 homolog (Digestive organ expansion factor homolog) (UTP25 small subunit processor component), partial [Durusdinium trenchii]